MPFIKLVLDFLIATSWNIFRYQREAALLAGYTIVEFHIVITYIKAHRNVPIIIHLSKLIYNSTVQL